MCSSVYNMLAVSVSSTQGVEMVQIKTCTDLKAPIHNQLLNSADQLVFIEPHTFDTEHI